MKFTKKELAVLELMARGMKSAEIRTALSIGASAFQHRRENIMRKLGATCDVQLGVLAERHQLIQRTPPPSTSVRRAKASAEYRVNAVGGGT